MSLSDVKHCYEFYNVQKKIDELTIYEDIQFSQRGKIFGTTTKSQCCQQKEIYLERRGPYFRVSREISFIHGHVLFLVH